MSIGAYVEPAIVKTAGGTIQLDILEAGSLIVAAGTTATSFRLPPIPAASSGYRFTFFNSVDQNMAILPPSTAGYVGAALTIGTLNNASAASVTYSTSSQKIGACCSVKAVGGKWWLVNDSVGAAATVA
jgi:hypothetical protein